MEDKKWTLVNFCEFDKYAVKSYCAIHNVDESLNLGDITKVDETKLKPFNMICGGSPCFVKGTKVYTNTGYKNIEDISIGDSVLTHTGKFQKVIKIGNKFSDDIYELKAQGILNTRVTGNHPYYIRTSKQKWNNAGRSYDRVFTNPEWKSVKDITKNDYIGIPLQLYFKNEGRLLNVFEKHNSGTIIDDIIWLPVRTIKKLDYPSQVYNLEVENDNSYTANNAIVHNCQDFSVAGKQKGSVWTCKDCGHEYNPLTVHWSKRGKCPQCNSSNIEKTRSSLLVEYLRVIRANKPNFGIYENVKNIVGKQFRDTTFKLFEDELHEYGYNTYWKILNSKNYGIPQNRERVYLIFIRKDIDNGQFKFPEPFDNGIRLKDMLEDEVDEKFYLSDDKVQKFLSNFNQSELPVTTRNSDTVSTIRATYYKNGERNVCENIENGNGYEGVVESNNVKQIGNISEGNSSWGNPQTGRIYSVEGICPTLNTCGGGQREPKIVCGIDKSNNHPSIIDNANCITCREDRGVSNRPSEGTMVIEMPSGNEPKLKDTEDITCLISDKGEKFVRETDTAVTLLARDYKGFDNHAMNAVVKIPQATKKGYIECPIGGVADLSYPNSKLRRGRVQGNGQICPTITATQTGVCKIESSIRIRKLTPRETWRLMGFSDQNFNAAKNVGISNSQLYKQAGNSIVVDVLYYIYVELYKAMPYLFDDLKLSSFFSGIGAFETALDRLYEGINSGNFINPQGENALLVEQNKY